jgi:23S rRNA (uracil1939-C5)-methyltransferase
VTEHLCITRIGHLGDGICDTPVGMLYVPYALPGETVEVEHWPGHDDRRHLIQVETASPERISPICPHFGTCGGCALQHWSGQSYRQWKRALVAEALARVAIETPVDELIDAHGEGRRRAVFHARRGPRDVLEVGFAARRSHRIVAVDHCPVLARSLDGAIAVAWAIAEQTSHMRKPLDISVTATGTGLDVDVRGSGPITAIDVAALAEVAQRHDLARLTRHGEVLFQREPPMLRIGRAAVALPPGAFLQATAAGEAALARLVTAHCAGASAVADLFCGVGPFALRLAERARVHALDTDAAAVAALAHAARRTPGLKPVATEARDLFRQPLRPEELNAFDAVIFNPPRQGAEAQARALAACAAPRVVAVSCNPATLARDARILLDGGYRLVQVTPLDQFLYSIHVEVVALFQRTDVG